MFLFAVGMQGTRTLIDFWLRSYVVEGDGTFDFLQDLFGGFVNIFLALLTLNLSVTLIQSLAFVASNLISAFRFFRKFNQSVMMSKMSFFDNTSVGRIIARYGSDIYSLDQDLSWFLR